MDRRFRAGHPWVYSNELVESPKGIEPGALIKLQDATGNPLALGYGNPNSLIAFRALIRGRELLAGLEPFSVDFLHQRLSSALSVRLRCGQAGVSFRLCYGEADFVPGLVVDRYLCQDDQFFVAQAHTAGADRLLEYLPGALERLIKEIPGSPIWAKTGIIYRNDLGVRKLEGLGSEQDPTQRVVRSIAGFDPSQSLIKVAGVIDEQPLLFRTDLVEGQKTGFFLDQAFNISIAAQKFKHLRAIKDPGKIRILDLCSYVGQWSTQLARVFISQGLSVEVTAVDASQTALSFAQENIAGDGAQVTLLKGDVLKDLTQLEDRSFDLVICDPPALIKSRKDIPTGKHAYLQVNTQVFRIVRELGAVVSCSCSGLFEDEEFSSTLSKAAYRNQVQVRWVARGAPAADHPMLQEFPEGRYLKSWFGWIGG